MIGMATASTNESPAAGEDTRTAYAIEYTIEGDVRFVSHHDEIRMLLRALRRADWPLAYSQGFNPQPRMTLVLPRSVGVASDCQLAVVQTNAEVAAEELHDRLAAALPPGCRLVQVVAVPRKPKPHAVAATYTVQIEAGEAEQLGPRIAELLKAEQVVVDRTGKPGTPARAIDIRPFVEELRLDGRTLRMVLRIAQQQSARPSEILTRLDLALDMYAHRIRRVQVQWDIELSHGGGSGDGHGENQN